MKKWLLGLLTAMMAVSLAACTPTTEKKQETTTTAAAAKQEQIEAKTLLFPMKISGHWKNAHRALCRLGLPLLMRTRRTVKS